MTPFIVLGLPRSRTFWLSRFLTFGDYQCGHENARFIRSLDDVRLWLSQDFTGTAETGVARWWRLIKHLRPDIKIVVVRRPVGDVVDSLLRLDLRGVCAFDRAALTREMHRLDRALDQVERAPGVLSVQFGDLASEDACKRVFEHCLPYPHDPAWWASLSASNLQTSMPALMRYALVHRQQMAKAGSACRRQMRAILRPPTPRPGAVSDDGIVIQEERLDGFRRDAQALFAEHCLAVGEAADEHLRKNLPLIERLEEAGAWQIMTARCNGRVLGYLATAIGPSLEAPDLTTATQTLFFASRDAKGLRLGMRLQQASIEGLRARGVGEVLMRAGVRGSGPKMGALFRRLGAEGYGELFKLKLKAA